jgi:uncharacterized protein YcfJ
MRMRVRDSCFDHARVVSVDRIVAAENEPVSREECWKEPHEVYHPGTTYQREVEQPIPGSFNNMEVRSETVERPGYYTRSDEQRCETRTEYQPAGQRTVAYDVVFRYNGQDFHERMDHDPGSRVRVHIDNGYVEVAE